MAMPVTGSLFKKYALFFSALVGGSLFISGLLGYERFEIAEIFQQFHLSRHILASEQKAKPA